MEPDLHPPTVRFGDDAGQFVLGPLGILEWPAEPVMPTAVDEHLQASERETVARVLAGSELPCFLDFGDSRRDQVVALAHGQLLPPLELPLQLYLAEVLRHCENSGGPGGAEQIAAMAGDRVSELRVVPRRRDHHEDLGHNAGRNALPVPVDHTVERVRSVPVVQGESAQRRCVQGGDVKTGEHGERTVRCQPIQLVAREQPALSDLLVGGKRCTTQQPIAGGVLHQSLRDRRRDLLERLERRSVDAEPTVLGDARELEMAVPVDKARNDGRPAAVQHCCTIAGGAQDLVPSADQDDAVADDEERRSRRYGLVQRPDSRVDNG